MSQLRGAWVPETKAEDDLLMDLHEVTRDAHKRGVDTEDIAAAMQFLGAAVVLYGDEDSPGAVVQNTDEPEQTASEKRETCPVCDDEIDSVDMFVGGEGFVQPCGCNVTADQVPEWVAEGMDQ